MESTLKNEFPSLLVKLGGSAGFMCCACGRYTQELLRAFGSTGGKATCKYCSLAPCDSCVLVCESGAHEQLHADNIQVPDEQHLFICKCGTPNTVDAESSVTGSWFKRNRQAQSSLVSFSGQRCRDCKTVYNSQMMKFKVSKQTTPPSPQPSPIRRRPSPVLTVATPPLQDVVEEEWDIEDTPLEATPPTAQFIPQSWAGLPTPHLSTINPLAFPSEVLHPAPPSSPVESNVPGEFNPEPAQDMTDDSPPDSLVQADNGHYDADSPPSSLILADQTISHSPDEFHQPPPPDVASVDEANEPKAEPILPFYLWIQTQAYNSDASPSPEDQNETALDLYLLAATAEAQMPDNASVSTISPLGSPVFSTPADIFRGEPGLVIPADPALIALPPSPAYSLPSSSHYSSPVQHSPSARSVPFRSPAPEDFAIGSSSEDNASIGSILLDERWERGTVDTEQTTARVPTEEGETADKQHRDEDNVTDQMNAEEKAWEEEENDDQEYPAQISFPNAGLGLHPSLAAATVEPLLDDGIRGLLGPLLWEQGDIGATF